jgi:ADP-heptose:LPS heptosyltransferase
MLERPRHAAGILFSRYHFRKTRDELRSFATAFSDARRLLLVMPLDGSPLFPVAPVVAMLARRKREEEITVVVAAHGTEALDALRRSPIIRLLPAEISSFYVPRRDVLARIMRTTYDVAIDCNLDFQLPSGYICRESKAPIRVGFAGKRSDLFYNFQVQVTPTESRMARYERLAHCLEMF